MVETLTLAAFDWSWGSVLGTVFNILLVALGLGLVIFFHELGHFAVAKWCNVQVERFSIGFGPILWSKKRGDTEYALSLIPFGGYVKMLGQDDMDPSQLTSEEIAENPHAYSSKKVWQRMAIISAGVIMNVITGMLFFAIAYNSGIQTPPAVVGGVRAGMPAWEAGLRRGDVITHINGSELKSFSDITRKVALTRGTVEIQATRNDKKLDLITITPDTSGSKNRRRIGVGLYPSLSLIEPRKSDSIRIAALGMPAENAGFKPGDSVFRVGDTDVDNYTELAAVLDTNRGKSLDFHLKRKKRDSEGDVIFDDEGKVSLTDEKVTVSPNPMRTLGLWMEIGKITAVRKNSPAERAGLKVGQKIVSVDDDKIGTEYNPMKLPDHFEKQCRAKHDVRLTVLPDKDATQTEEIIVHFQDQDDTPLAGWSEPPGAFGVPLSLPALGVAVEIIPVVMHVEENRPASELDENKNPMISAKERIKSMEFYVPEGGVEDGIDKNKPFKIPFDSSETKKNETEIKNWPYAFHMMQIFPTRSVRLKVANEKGQTRIIEIDPTPEDDWFYPSRGINFNVELVELKAENMLDAVSLGYSKAKDTISDIYLTIRSLVGAQLSYKELSGPVGIAKVAYAVADQGYADLLLFLGFLSINLAVLNFLPIPVLDGGHMVFLCWEAITRKKPSERVMIAATYLGMAFVLGLMGLVLYLDIFVNAA